MTNVDSIKQECFDFAYVGLDHAIDSIANSGGPLVPFILTQTGGERKLQRFVTEKYEDGPLEAENYLKNLGSKPDKALIAFDGLVTLEGQRSDAILVKCYDKMENEGIILAQIYISKIDNKGIEPLGNAVFLGTDVNIIKSS